MKRFLVLLFFSTFFLLEISAQTPIYVRPGGTGQTFQTGNFNYPTGNVIRPRPYRNPYVFQPVLVNPGPILTPARVRMYNQGVITPVVTTRTVRTETRVTVIVINLDLKEEKRP